MGMTPQEAIELIESARKTMYLPKSKEYISDFGYALEMAIKALEQQPSEDCVSREAIRDVLIRDNEMNGYSDRTHNLMEKILDLPSVTPSYNSIKPELKPSEDCISRQATLDIINFEDEWLFDANSHNADTKIAFSTIKSKISEMPSVTPKTRWIPCSERLPEEETDVLICNRDGDIALSRGTYSTEAKDCWIWYTSGWRFGKVTAWMPLPEPYRESEE